MHHVVAVVKVEDPLKWWETFRGVGATLRESHGIASGAEVYRGDDPNELLIVFACDDRAAVQRYLSDPLVQRNLEAGGVLESKINVLRKLGDAQ